MAQKVPYALAALLIFWFLSSVFITAHEYPMRSEQVLTMVLEAAALTCVISMRSKMPMWLFVLALACGLGLFAIRFASDSAWWTGHLHYSLLPR